MFVPLQGGFDVFNALDLMDNKQFLEKLKFGIGDGNLQYYLYNWRCPPMQPDQVIAETIKGGAPPLTKISMFCAVSQNYPHLFET